MDETDFTIDEIISLEEKHQLNNIKKNDIKINDIDEKLKKIIDFLPITKQEIPFNLRRRLGFEQIVNIINISGLTAWVIITPAPIKSIDSLEFGFSGLSLKADFTESSDYEPQKISIMNNTKFECELDNNMFYFTLFFYVDGKWKQTWKNRKFNGKKYDINILERHVKNATNIEDIPK